MSSSEPCSAPCLQLEGADRDHFRQACRGAAPIRSRPATGVRRPVAVMLQRVWRPAPSQMSYIADMHAMERTRTSRCEIIEKLLSGVERCCFALGAATRRSAT